MLNTDLQSPTFRPFTLGEDLTAANRNPSGGIFGTLRAIDIYGPGDVEVIDINGTTRKRTFAPAAGSFIRWVVQVAQVTVNTTVDILLLDGLA